jgi:hypothetical protein
VPTYELYDTKKKKVFEVWMSVSAYEQYLKDNPNVIRYFETAPGFAMDGKSFLDAPAKLGGFREVLQKIGEKHPDSPVDDRFRATPRNAKRVKTDIAVGKALKKRKEANEKAQRRSKW